jgi:predicted enzyme related to lactoylglutathione lyase
MAIEVEDMDKAIEFLKSKGVEISRAPMALGKSKRAEIKDPSGFTIELRQW